MKHFNSFSLIIVFALSLLSINVYADSVEFRSSFSVIDFFSSHSFKNSSGDITLRINQDGVKANGTPISAAIVIDDISSTMATFHCQNPYNGVTMHFRVYTDGTLYYVEGRETYKANVDYSNNKHQPIGEV